MNFVVLISIPSLKQKKDIANSACYNSSVWRI